MNVEISSLPISDSQKAVLYEYLMGRLVLSLQNTLPDAYHGAGHGWVEVDASGLSVEMSYADAIDGPVDREQNVDMMRFVPTERAMHGKGWKVIGQRLRLMVNFSAWEACGF